ncbi:uncharacterized protein LOC129572532 [Sitodiplosis mosellana]|uniref:uncharacterized protein LOC129572532 n=1 Tax=Sitodiplosis mosellana TaxID=263140 RepID=UPI002444DE4E|nr:uncharacterized protein LOC129572532 [Sitodiplosis mosellana]
MLSRRSFTLLLVGLMISQFLVVNVHGVNVNERDANGDTVLHRAASAGQMEEAQKLLDEGADPKIRNNIGLTALHLAAQNGNVEYSFLLNKKLV